jgi:AmpD protein
VLGKDGSIVQMVSLDRAAHHAGASTLAGCRRGVNRCSIGIEIVNWGMLTKRGDAFYTHNGKRYTGPTPAFARGRYWEPFTDAQYGALIRLTNNLLSLYPGITHITGHEDIAPNRKTDPGGAFDWQRIRAGLSSLFVNHIGPLNVKVPTASTVSKEMFVESESQPLHSYFEVERESDWEDYEAEM